MKERAAYWRIFASLLVVLLLMGLIFWFSAQPAPESQAQSGQVLRVVEALLAPFLDRLPHGDRLRALDVLTLLIRKAGHFTEYTLLGAALWVHLRQVSRVTALKWAALWSWLAGTLYAATDEWHQVFVPGRDGRIWDVLLDSAGVLTGVLLAMALVTWGSKRRNKRK